MKHILLILSFISLVAASAFAAEPDKPVVAAAPVLPPVAKVEGAAVPASGFFPVLPFDAASDAAPMLLPVASNHALDGDHKDITRAIVILHDQSRDANAAAAMIAALAGPSNTSTLIVAPQFLVASDIERFKEHLPEGGQRLAYWKMDAWVDGGESVSPTPMQKGVSSFTAVDLLLIYLGDKIIFPNITDIVVAGHGAGADFALRYAALGQTPDLLDPKKTTLRFVAANASSYLYFTLARPTPSKPGFVRPDDKACPGYNDYRYGLAHLNDYGKRSGGDDIRLRYPSRLVTLLAGTKSGAEDQFADTACAAMLQGPNRFLRALNYGLYIRTIYGGEAEETQHFSAIKDVGYDAVAMFDSPCGMSALFGDGECAAPVRN